MAEHIAQGLARKMSLVCDGKRVVPFGGEPKIFPSADFNGLNFFIHFTLDKVMARLA